MKKYFLWAGLAVLGLIAVSWATGMLKLGVNSGKCFVDNEIDPDKRAEIEAFAMSFAQTMFSGNVSAAYAQMTPEVQHQMPIEKFQAMGNRALSNLRVGHTYFLTSRGGGPEAPGICGLLNGNQWVSVALKPGLNQAHVLLSAQTRNNGWAVNLWLLPQGDTWRVQYFNLALADIVGLGPEVLLDMARKQRDAGRMFNAAMLYSGLQSIINRGPVFHLGIANDVESDIKHFSLPTELQGSAPFHWNFGGKIYAVRNVSMIGVDHQLGLIFILPLEKWDGDVAANMSNHAFLDGFMAEHPQYSASFQFLVARAMKPDNSGGFGTVYSPDKGYR